MFCFWIHYKDAKDDEEGLEDDDRVARSEGAEERPHAFQTHTLEGKCEEERERGGEGRGGRGGEEGGGGGGAGHIPPWRGPIVLLLAGWTLRVRGGWCVWSRW